MEYSVMDEFRKGSKVPDTREEKLQYLDRIERRMMLSSPNNGEKEFYYKQNDRTRRMYKFIYIGTSLIVIAGLVFIMLRGIKINSSKLATAFTAVELLIVFYLCILVGNQLAVKNEMTRLKCSLCVWQFRFFLGLAATVFLVIAGLDFITCIRQGDFLTVDIVCGILGVICGGLLLGLLVMDLRRKVLRISVNQAIPDIDSDDYWDFLEEGTEG